MWGDRQDNHSSTKCSQVELQLIKMTNVTRDIRMVIQNILDAKDLQKRVDEELLENFSTQLRSILQNLKYFPTSKMKLNTFKVSQKITECREEDEHSEKTNNRYRDRQRDNYLLQSSHLIKQEGRESIDINQLFEENKQLIEENEFYTKKLQQAESYIKKMQYEQGALMAEISGLKNDQKYNIKPSNKTDHYEEKQSQSFQNQLVSENQELRAQLQETKQFIMKNNEDFVRQLQKYNQKIWRLQRQSEQNKHKMGLLQSKTDQSELLINRLRQQNFQLEVLARNMKNLIGQQDRNGSLRDYSQAQDSDRFKIPNSKLKDFFRERVQQSLRRKDTD